MLCHLPVAGIRTGIDHVAVGQRQFPCQAALRLTDALAGIEGIGNRRRLPRVLRHLCRGEPQRILSLGLIQHIDHQRDAPRAAQVITQFGIAGIAPRRTVIAVTVGLEARNIDHRVQRPVLAAVLLPEFPAVVTAGTGIGGEGRICGTIGRENLHHATRGIAVQTGKRTAQHLNAFRRRQIEGRCLTLPVGHGRRNAVSQQSHTAHAEGRP